MKTQYRDSDGLLNCLTYVPADSSIFEMLMEASEVFDPCVIRRSLYLSDEQRKELRTRAMNPISLKHQGRVFFRRIYGRNLPENVPCLVIPATLKQYLLHEHS